MQHVTIKLPIDCAKMQSKKTVLAVITMEKLGIPMRNSQGKSGNRCGTINRLFLAWLIGRSSEVAPQSEVRAGC